MKKLLALIPVIALLLVAGCGPIDIGPVQPPNPIVLPLNGSGLGTSFVMTLPVKPNIKFPFTTTVNDVTYSVSANTGGTGNISMWSQAAGTTCPTTAPTTTPLVSLTIPAGATPAPADTPFTSFGAATAAGFTSLMNQTYVLCLYGTQSSTAPVNATVTLQPTATVTVGGI